MNEDVSLGRSVRTVLFSYTTLLEKSILKNFPDFWEARLSPSRIKICLFRETEIINSCLLR